MPHELLASTWSRRPDTVSAGEDRLSSALEEQLKSPRAIYRNVAWLDKPSPGAEPQDGVPMGWRTGCADGGGDRVRPGWT